MQDPQQERQAEAPPTGPRPRWRRIAAAFAAVLLAAVVVINLAAGPIVRGKIVSIASEELGVPVHLDSVRLYPFFNGLTLTNFRIANPAGFSAGDCVSVESLDVKVSLASLLAGDTITLARLRLDGPKVRAETNEAGELNFRKLQQGMKKDGPKKEKKAGKGDGKKESKPQPGVEIRRFKLSNVRIEMVQGGPGGGEVALTIREVSSRGLKIPPPGASGTAPARIEAKDFTLTNPKGFEEPSAFAMKELGIELDFAEASKSRYSLPLLAFEKPTIVQEVADGDSDNFRAISRIMNALKEGASPQKAKEKDRDSSDDGEKAAKPPKPGPQTRIDKLLVLGASFIRRDGKGVESRTTVVSGLDVTMRSLQIPSNSANPLDLTVALSPFDESSRIEFKLAGHPQAEGPDRNARFSATIDSLPLDKLPKDPKQSMQFKSGKLYGTIDGQLAGDIVDCDVVVRFRDLGIEAAGGGGLLDRLKSAGAGGAVAALQKPGTNETQDIAFKVHYDVKSGKASGLEEEMMAAMLKAMLHEATDLGGAAGGTLKDAGGVVGGAGLEAGKALESVGGAIGGLLGGGGDEEKEDKK